MAQLFLDSGISVLIYALHYYRLKKKIKINGKCLAPLILRRGSCLAEFNLNVVPCYCFKRTTVISNKHKLFRA